MVERASGPPIAGDAVILTGGMSTRMGTDKALLIAGGETLLARLLGALRRLFLRVHLSTDPRRPYPGYDAPAIPDSTPGLGPLEGVRASLASLGAPALFAAVDLAEVSAPLARALWEAGAAAGRRGAVPRWRGGLEPAFAVYGPGLLPEIAAFLDRGRRDLRQLAGLDGVKVLDLEDAETQRAVFGDGLPDLEAVFRNLNRPADMNWGQPPIFQGKIGGCP